MTKGNIIDVHQFTQQEWTSLIQRAVECKEDKDQYKQVLSGKRVGLVFDSNSLRTKISFETAAYLLGADSYFVSVDTVTQERDGTPREIYEDIIETLDRMVDCYVLRDYSRKLYDVFIRKEYPPFINGLCEVGHPSQALADLGVLQWKKKKVEGLNYAGVCPVTGSGVIESYVYGVLLLGENVTLITPTGEFAGKNKDFDEQVKRLSKEHGGTLSVTKDIASTVAAADVLYVDEWWENDPDFLKKKMGEYKVDSTFLQGSKKDLSVLHCLPAHHGREIESDVIYGDQSLIFDQAEFRVYSAMSLLLYLFE